MQGSFPAQDGGSERLVEYWPGETDFDDKRRAGTFFQSSNDYFAIYGDKYTLQVRGSYFTSKRVFTQLGFRAAVDVRLERNEDVQPKRSSRGDR